VFGSRGLRRIFGPKREEVTGRWRRLNKEELRNFCASLNIIREIKSRRVRWVGYVAGMGEMRSSYKVFVGKPERRRSL
jgi:hypothetical protein